MPASELPIITDVVTNSDGSYPSRYTVGRYLSDEQEPVVKKNLSGGQVKQMLIDFETDQTVIRIVVAREDATLPGSIAEDHIFVNDAFDDETKELHGVVYGVLEGVNWNERDSCLQYSVILDPTEKKWKLWGDRLCEPSDLSTAAGNTLWLQMAKSGHRNTSRFKPRQIRKNKTFTMRSLASDSLGHYEGRSRGRWSQEKIETSIGDLAGNTLFSTDSKPTEE